ncbi:hypothetical protein D9611_003102 [Ephemerocybe angulata]|uniref:Glycosyltransferase family 32 protein n=1 Tax=Ephemerocybe angulata TaxID=980116 RepID=A0A8H5C9P3_9AGAR|nr:hypothetical protein D9611_003102 [Tulosesus angulatus]
MAQFFTRHPRLTDPPPRRRLSVSSPLPLSIFSSSSPTPSAVQEKFQRKHPHISRWWFTVAVPLPGLRRRLRIFLPNVRQIHLSSMARFGRKRGSLLFALGLFLACFLVFAIGKRFGTPEKQWPSFTDSRRTLVYKREDLQRIWEWEVSSGHYPSRHPIPSEVRLRKHIENPSLPLQRPNLTPEQDSITSTHGEGPRRVYFARTQEPPNTAYPPRPVPGSVADLDMVMEHCDFTEHKYVRDCLEVLRVGAGLDNGKRMRRSKLDDWKYIYIEQPNNGTQHYGRAFDDGTAQFPSDQPERDDGLVKRKGVDWEAPPVQLPPVAAYKPYYTLQDPCDPESIKVFHMFWTGPFTDKPYAAILSFLYTQNLGLHKGAEKQKNVCRPQMWMWISPGPAASVVNPNALGQMYDELKNSPWASPFLHPKFKDVVKFKLWNTTEQLDSIEELKDEWRGRNLFNSDGWEPVVAKEEKAQDQGGSTMDDTASARQKEEDELVKLAGSKSSATYDRLSVILSDMARFILLHRYGGIYLDADTLFLRDWEELWNWKGAFTYRWSRLPRYNTAVLKMNKNSALGKFLFRTALKNNLDFHPSKVTVYTREAFVEPLLLRLPDALFDSAWLNTEDYQMDRPPQPFFTRFEDFFETPITQSGAPQALGFDGFFKGAFSYHYHNCWWKPFDPARNWPDLGPRFSAAEQKARAELKGKLSSNGKGHVNAATVKTKGGYTQAGGESHAHVYEDGHGDSLDDDQLDLSWATVMKRTFEAYVRGEIPNMYGEWLDWES